MRQFMSEKTLSFAVCGRILAVVKYNLISNRICSRAHGTCGRGSLIVRVHADPTKVVTEPRLKESAGCPIQWLPRTSQNVVHNWRHTVRCGGRSLSLQQGISSIGAGFFPSARIALSSRRVFPAGTLALDHGPRHG